MVVGFIMYSIILGVGLGDDAGGNDGEVKIYQDVDDITAKFLLVCMAFITVILIIDTICEVMFYNTIKKFMEAKLQCNLCKIPCQRS